MRIKIIIECEVDDLTLGQLARDNVEEILADLPWDFVESVTLEAEDEAPYVPDYAWSTTCGSTALSPQQREDAEDLS